MKISSFPSLNGVTWVLADGFCVLGYFKTERQAKAGRAAIKRGRKAAYEKGREHGLASDPERGDPPGPDAP